MALICEWHLIGAAWLFVPRSCDVTTQIIWFTEAKMFATGPFRIRHLVPALSPGGGDCLIFKCLPDPLNPRDVPGFPHGSEGHLLAQPLVALCWGRWDGLWWGVGWK